MTQTMSVTGWMVRCEAAQAEADRLRAALTNISDTLGDRKLPFVHEELEWAIKDARQTLSGDQPVREAEGDTIDAAIIRTRERERQHSETERAVVEAAMEAAEDGQLEEGCTLKQACDNLAKLEKGE